MRPATGLKRVVDSSQLLRTPDEKGFKGGIFPSTRRGLVTPADALPEMATQQPDALADRKLQRGGS